MMSPKWFAGSFIRMYEYIFPAIVATKVNRLFETVESTDATMKEVEEVMFETLHTRATIRAI
ncbi:hypothetical protein [Aneurinibacillus migulanus]|uniref:Uncharacterized protein n=3 Tax=Aneurinibacillus migulanus TaxID=47500 RepID=A0A1G8YD06_ANEMI|nr:hypothetical protein [Aneurinibacillus migulanus]MCP1357941.1 hypothetical protein [Aneurinibacillus migulanus]MED4732112.1 hypothetical protein [Aneurinibacillus migulanus]SDK00728.1 hypothetical protein SAMN04487909_13563 [Aneurinibacillus migulanus]